MTILITYINNKKLIISHGIDYYTNDTIVLPQIHPKEIGGIYNTRLGWIIP